MTKNSNNQLPPTILTIFGITGDLSRRKLLPALYYLADGDKLPEAFKIVGVTRRGTTTEKVIEDIEASLHERGETCSKDVLDKLRRAIQIVTMDIVDPAEYLRLKEQLDDIENVANDCMHRLFYLATPSEMFEPVTELLDKSGLNTGCQHGIAESRLLIEKPLGYDLDSAISLIKTISQAFKDRQLYLIDHYLSKPAVQNLVAFSLDGDGPEPAWNKDHISRIIVTADESLGIEGRSVFYEQMGALRDVLQSHLFQLLAIVTMDKPANSSAEAIHASKLKILKAIRPITANKAQDLTVRGQYVGYKDEVKNCQSNVETFAAVKLEVDSERWHGVPIILRTGKNLKVKTTKVTLVLKVPDSTAKHNLVIHIEPNGDHNNSNSVLKYRDDYENVLVGAAMGDKTLFATKEEVLASWRIIDPILEAWKHDRTELCSYKPGSDGPELYKELL